MYRQKCFGLFQAVSLIVGIAANEFGHADAGVSSVKLPAALPRERVPEGVETAAWNFQQRSLRMRAADPRRGAGVVDQDSLENCCACKRTVGSNPTPSASGTKKGLSYSVSHSLEFLINSST